MRTQGAQLEGFTTYFTSAFSFDLYTKPWALVSAPEVTFSMISEYSGTEKGAGGLDARLSVDAQVWWRHTK